MLVLSAKDTHVLEQEDTFASIFFIPKDYSDSNSDIELVAKKYDINVLAFMQAHDFTGKTSDILTIPVIKDDAVHHLIFVGIGEAKKNDKRLFELYRRSLASAIKKAQACRATTIGVQLPLSDHFGVTPYELAYHSATIAKMSTYCFDEFLAKETREECVDIVGITFCSTENISTITQAVDHGFIVANSVNRARHWVDLPPNMLTPPHLSDRAQEIVDSHDNLRMTVFGEHEIIEMGMGGLAAVSRGSDLDCRLLFIEYTPEQKSTETLAFVGKGITFDSGGLSLKPSRYMETMKEDMSGAAAVIASMQAIAELKPSVNIVAVAPLSENLPSGKATKPGDIVTFYNGKTAEIKNTDAEGRLVLADALAYTVEKYNPTMMIDLATLTGACAHALGPFYTGMFSLHDSVAEKVKQSGDRSGDYVWRLPMSDDYKKALKSPAADISNIGDVKIMAGGTTAAHFLQHFVGDTPWVHLDIAGTAFNVPNISYYQVGATGAGVRLLVDLSMNWSNK